MSCAYISSNDERLYAAVELSYGQVPAVESRHRFPAVALAARQQVERPERKDKTGTRTYPGTAAGLRKRTTFEVKTYLTSWARQDMEPAYGALVESSLGGAPQFFNGGTAVANANPKLLTMAGAHGLQVGQAVTAGGELRFVVSLVDAATVELNAPFTVTPETGAPVGPTVTYQPATGLETVSIFDYWSPAEAVQRIVSGAAVNQFRIGVNGDYHELSFSGFARDIIDNASFAGGQGELMSFPEEPALEQFGYDVVPGHLGQAWLGNTPDRFYTITSAEVAVDNDIEPRGKEFGSDVPRCVSAGLRTVTVDLELYEQYDAATKALYQAARQFSPIGVMLQLGQQSGQLFGVYLKSVVPEVPEFDDTDRRLQWKFTSCRAQGTGNDEVVVAFG